MHFQNPVPNWDKALIKMPDWSLLKSVNDGGLLLDGYSKWVAAGRDPNKLYLDYRHHDLDYTFSTDWDEMVEKWRMNFDRFIDGTYLEKYAPYIKLIEELNEYTDTRMVADKALLAPHLTSAKAAVWVWNNEYRGKTLERGGTVGVIPSDCRLVICNSPVGNDIPIEFFQLCRDEDAVLGVRTYTKWWYKERDPEDFRWHSGRPFYNEQAYGIKVDYVLGESGPYNGSTSGGWRHGSCMGGDKTLLISGMLDWIRDLKTTTAYQEGRILGPGAWFTSKQPAEEEKWTYYLLWESELTPLAEMCAQEWQPESVDPDPTPEPDPLPDECRGKPRTQYARTVNVIPDTATDEEATAIFLKGWQRSKETTGGSYDDAGIGDLDKRNVNLHGIHDVNKQIFVDWYNENYPGVNVAFFNIPSENAQIEIIDIVDELPKHETLVYDTRLLSDITTLTIHHTVSPPDRTIASIASYHVTSRGWPGIAYHYVIKDSGEIYQTNYLTTKSYHAGSYNAPGDENLVSIGIALQGNFTDSPPPQAQLDATKWLVGELKGNLDIGEVLGHKDMPGASTACPGATSPGWFPYIAE